MHNVLKHLLQRAGRSGPFVDGRKIILVLWGGIMRGARGGGAMQALQSLGLSTAFDEIYTVSAGFPLACYLLAQQAERGMRLLPEDLGNKNFFDPWRFWKGMDVDYLLRAMQGKNGFAAEAILDQPTKLFTRVVNIQTKALEYLEVHEVGQKFFWPLMQAAVSVPVLYPHPATINGKLYIDTNFNGRLKEHMRYCLNTDATDILVIYNATLQRQFKASDENRVYEICPLSQWRLSRFERRPEFLMKASALMKELVLNSFQKN